METSLPTSNTFQIDEADNELDSAGVFYENNERVVRQKQSKITVVIGNPPYSAGSRTSGFDSHPSYKYLDKSIRDSYARYSSATLKSKLYDSYVGAFRWASNRLGDSGVVAIITNSSFIDGNTADGLRKAFAEEFGKIYIYDLRGRIRGKSGDFAKREGGNVFPIMTGVAIAVPTAVPAPTSHYRRG
jgi:predicted helicase